MPTSSAYGNLLPLEAQRQNDKTLESNNMKEKLIDFPKTVFIGQREYFRQTYFDAVKSGFHQEFNIKVADVSPLAQLPQFIKDNDIEMVIFFRPEWFSWQMEAFEKTRELGVPIVGFSTEPIPLNGIDPHEDQLLRLGYLKDAVQLELDLLVHFEPNSTDALEELGFTDYVTTQLPVSSEIFHPRNNVKKIWDISFLGRFTQHREDLLMRARALHEVIQIAHGALDEQARWVLTHSEIVLNIHNHNYLNYETRIGQALLCGKKLLSEHLSNDLITESEHIRFFDGEEQMMERLEEMLSDGTANVQHPPEVLKSFHINRLFETILAEMD